MELKRKRSEKDFDKSTLEAVAAYSNYDGMRPSTLDDVGSMSILKQLTGLDDTVRGAFGVNTDRLVTLKKRCDPQNIFNRFVNLLPTTE